MSLRDAWMEREQQEALRARFPGLKDAVIDVGRCEVAAVAWNGLVGRKRYSDVQVVEARVPSVIFEVLLDELRAELAPEAL